MLLYFWKKSQISEFSGASPSFVSPCKQRVGKECKMEVGSWVRRIMQDVWEARNKMIADKIQNHGTYLGKTEKEG